MMCVGACRPETALRSPRPRIEALSRFRKINECFGFLLCFWEINIRCIYSSLYAGKSCCYGAGLLNATASCQQCFKSKGKTNKKKRGPFGSSALIQKLASIRRCGADDVAVL